MKLKMLSALALVVTLASAIAVTPSLAQTAKAGAATTTAAPKHVKKTSKTHKGKKKGHKKAAAATTAAPKTSAKPGK